MARTNRIQIVTPKGTAVYPWLNRPDTKFSDDGEYKVTLKVPAEDAQDLINKLDNILDEYLSEQSSKDPKVGRFKTNAPYEEEVDDNGNLTGNYLFKFKQKAKVHTKDGRTIDMKVALFDASRTPTQAAVGGGSELKVAATVWPYVMPATKSVGLSLRPSAVQILSLVSLSSGVANVFDVEDGFTDDGTTEQVTEETEEEYAATDF
jgi:hypothetical protein